MDPYSYTYTEAELRLIADIRILLDRYGCELVVEIDRLPGPAGQQREHHTAMILGEGIAILVDAALARAVRAAGA